MDQPPIQGGLWSSNACRHFTPQKLDLIASLDETPSLFNPGGLDTFYLTFTFEGPSGKRAQVMI